MCLKKPLQRASERADAPASASSAWDAVNRQVWAVTVLQRIVRGHQERNPRPEFDWASSIDSDDMEELLQSQHQGEMTLGDRVDELLAPDFKDASAMAALLAEAEARFAAGGPSSRPGYSPGTRPTTRPRQCCSTCFGGPECRERPASGRRSDVPCWPYVATRRQPCARPSACSRFVTL